MVSNKGESTTHRTRSWAQLSFVNYTHRAEWRSARCLERHRHGDLLVNVRRRSVRHNFRHWLLPAHVRNRISAVASKLPSGSWHHLNTKIWLSISKPLNREYTVEEPKNETPECKNGATDKNSDTRRHLINTDLPT